MAILLGGVLLDGFEAPAGVRYGGAQALAVHRLPGGARIIDAMGPDDANIVWRGYLSGPDAADRARQLDTMRAIGAQASLAWDGAYYDVVIAQLELVYCNAWWIHYTISCTVVTASAATTTGGMTAPLAQIFADLTAASAWTDVAAASDAMAVAEATSVGTPANAAAVSSIDTASQMVQSGITSADAGMGSTDVPSLVAAAGRLAELVAASGYIGRAAITLANAGS
jgi:hypothetical protein